MKCMESYFIMLNRERYIEHFMFAVSPLFSGLLVGLESGVKGHAPVHV